MGELAFRVSDDFGLRLPYRDYFKRLDSTEQVKKNKDSIQVKGDYWAKKELSRTAHYNAQGYHAPDNQELLKNYSRNRLFFKDQQLVYLLGDSVTESINTEIDEIYYQVVNQNNPDIVIIPRYMIASTMEGVNYLLNDLDNFISEIKGKSKKRIYPDIVVAQIRPMSYRGEGLAFIRKDGKTQDLRLNQEKLSPSSLLKHLVLAPFYLESSNKLFQGILFGPSHFLSFLAFKYYKWNINSFASIPNNEKFLIDKDPDEEHWQNFEKSLIKFITSAKAKNIKPAILLAPGSPRNEQWVNNYKHSRTLSKNEKRYIELFRKHNIPYAHPVKDFAKASLEKPVFWKNDGHPNKLGNKLLANSLERLIIEIKDKERGKN